MLPEASDSSAMHTTQGGPCAVQYYTSNSNLCIPESYDQILLLCQMVYDKKGQEEATSPVVLMYDLWTPADDEAISVVTRYNRLQQIRHCFEGRTLGVASLSVQWAGNVCHRTKLYEMNLPHKMNGLFLLKDNFQHTHVLLPNKDVNANAN